MQVAYVNVRDAVVHAKAEEEERETGCQNTRIFTRARAKPVGYAGSEGEGKKWRITKRGHHEPL